MCVAQSQPITISISVRPPSISVEHGLNGNTDEGGICLFSQKGVTSITLGQIRPLIDAILDHKCTTCGSVPIHLVERVTTTPAAEF